MMIKTWSIKMRSLRNLIYISVTPNLGIDNNERFSADSVDLSEHVNKAISKYHHSIISIKTNCSTYTKHSFNNITTILTAILYY